VHIPGYPGANHLPDFPALPPPLPRSPRLAAVHLVVPPSARDAVLREVVGLPLRTLPPGRRSGCQRVNGPWGRGPAFGGPKGLVSAPPPLLRRGALRQKGPGLWPHLPKKFGIRPNGRQQPCDGMDTSRVVRSWQRSNGRDKREARGSNPKRQVGSVFWASLGFQPRAGKRAAEGTRWVCRIPLIGRSWEKTMREFHEGTKSCRGGMILHTSGLIMPRAMPRLCPFKHNFAKKNMQVLTTKESLD